MGKLLQSWTQFWRELKRRRVIHVVVVYSSVAYVLIELSNNVTEPMHLPEWTPSLVILILLIGFPLAIILSWIFDITSKGIVKTESLSSFRKRKDFKPMNGSKRRFENSVAVLPIKDFSPEKDQEYFCDGMTEEIINTLTHVDRIKVIARNSVFALREKNVNYREIGHWLNVENLLEGSVRKDGMRLRVTAQLIKVTDSSLIWSEHFDRNMDDVFAIQDEISLAIVDNMKVKLLGDEIKEITKHPTHNLEAYNLYLKGNYYSQLLTTEGFEKAIDFYKQALNKDPQFALAYTGLAISYMHNTVFGFTPPNKVHDTIKEYAGKALAIDNKLPEAHSVLGLINLYYYWDWNKAEDYFQRALQLNPNSVTAHIYYSYLLTFTNRHEEAIAEAKRAQEIDPISSYVNTHLGQAYYYNSQYDMAIKELKSVISMTPDYCEAHLFIAMAYSKSMMFKNSIVEFKRAYDLSNGLPMVAAGQAAMFHALKRYDQANQILEDLQQRSKTEYIHATSFFVIYNSRGDMDLAYKWLEQAVEEHDSMLPWFIVHPDRLARVPDEPRFQALVKKIGLKKIND